MNENFATLAELCSKRGLSCTSAELKSIEWLARKLDVASEEIVSMIVLELLEEQSPPASGISTLLSRIKKRIVRDYEKQRRSTSLAVEPLVSHDESEQLDLEEAIESLSPLDAEIVRLALDGATFATISKDVRKSTRTVYRRLRDALSVIKEKLK